MTVVNPTVDRIAEVISRWCWDHSGFEGCAFHAYSRGVDANTRYGIAQAIADDLNLAPEFCRHHPAERSAS